MIRTIVVAATLASACLNNCFAQDEYATTKKFDHYIGVQANQLFRQILNLNASNTAITNPYLITYSVHSVKCGGWGVNAGFGYDFHDILNNLTPTNQESKINDLFYRVGVGRKVKIGKRFEAGYGVDYVGTYQLDKTFSGSVTTSGNQTDSTASISTSKTTTSGYGVQVTLGFHLSDHILISTEATYYRLKSRQISNVLNSEIITNTSFPSNDSATLSSSNNDITHSDFTFSIPVALFLVLKF